MLQKYYGKPIADKILANMNRIGRARQDTCLAFAKTNIPDVQRYVEIINPISGVSTSCAAGVKHYVNSRSDFSFDVTFPNGEPLKVLAKGYYSQEEEELVGTELGGGVFRYTITRIIEPWEVTISSVGTNNYVDNAEIGGENVWAYGNTLYIKAEAAGRASVYSLSGVLLKQIDVNAGLTTETLERGVYIVELDGKHHKVIVK